MYRPDTAGWGVQFDPAPLLAHAALYVRDGTGLAVDAPENPPHLLTAPPPLAGRLSDTDWLRWWRSLLEVQTTPADARALLTAYDRHSPVGVAELSDEPLIWASRQVKAAAPFRDGEFGLPILEAVRRLGHETGGQSALDVAVVGLAVEGEWRYVSPDGSLVLASWSTLQSADEWLTEALRPAWLANLT